MGVSEGRRLSALVRLEPSQRKRRCREAPSASAAGLSQARRLTVSGRVRPTTLVTQTDIGGGLNPYPFGQMTGKDAPR